VSTLLAFVPQRWDAVFQRPQHLMSRLTRWHRVIYVEEPLARGVPRLERRQPCEGVLVLRPHGASGWPGLQAGVLRALLDEALADAIAGPVVAWLGAPETLPLLQGLSPRAVVYDCTDGPDAAPDAALLDAADVVLAAGPALWRAKRALHPNVHCVPNAVDAAHFAPERVTARCAEYLAAERLQGHILAPRLGYAGVIDRRVDLALLDSAAAARPDWHFVMVGPRARVPLSALPRRANLHWLGAQPYARLPALVAGWDVCLLPFKVDERTRWLSPTKTLEYLAAEKPVVSTAIGDVVAMYGHVVHIARDAGQFVAACEAALHETPARRAERLVQAAGCVAGFTWDQAARVVQRLIEDAVAAMPPVKPAGAAARRPAASSSADTW
jgi:glycosyltransferase involved in cell wall biosynthesis